MDQHTVLETPVAPRTGNTCVFISGSLKKTRTYSRAKKNVLELTITSYKLRRPAWY